MLITALDAIPVIPQDLPHRPWLRRDQPLLWRDDSTLEAGWGARRLLLTGVPRDLLGWAYRLRGERTLDEVIEQCATLGQPPERARALLTALTAVGALDDAAIAPTCLREMNPDERDVAAAELAALRLSGRSPRAAAAALDGRRRAVIAVDGEGPLAEDIARALRTAGVTEVMRQAPPPDGSRRNRGRARRITAQVLTDDWYPDCLDDRGSMGHDLPHLPVVVHGDRAVIGPLVVPGITGCLRCADLHRRDADPAYPLLMAQVATRRPRHSTTDPLLRSAASIHAALILRDWIDSGGPEHHRAGRATPGATGAGITRTITLGEAGATDTVLRAHALCGCRWRVA